MRMLVLPLLCALAAAAGCSSRCDDLHARAIGGRYQLDSEPDAPASIGELELSAASLEASEDQVVVTYKSKDGQEIRATYRVKQKSKL